MPKYNLKKNSDMNIQFGIFEQLTTSFWKQSVVFLHVISRCPISHANTIVCIYRFHLLWSTIGYRPKFWGVLASILIVPNLPLQWNVVFVHSAFFHYMQSLRRFLSILNLSFSKACLIVWVVNIYVGWLLKFHYLISDYLCQ